MSTETNKAVVHRYVEEGFNAANMAVIDELFVTDFVHHDPSVPTVRDLEGLKQLILAQHAAFADVRTTIEDLVADRDKVVKRFTVRGTHTGDFNGIPPTGKQFTLEGIDILRLVDGKIQEIWIAYDMLGVLQQLGVMPQPEEASV
jgi:steroid delta-isomerase-like uncharacterized protein